MEQQATKTVPTKPYIISNSEEYITIIINQQPSILLQPYLIEDMMNAVLDTTTGEILEYCHLIMDPN